VGFLEENRGWVGGFTVGERKLVGSLEEYGGWVGFLEENGGWVGRFSAEERKLLGSLGENGGCPASGLLCEERRLGGEGGGFQIEKNRGWMGY
jgi:hypothetical protein